MRVEILLAIGLCVIILMTGFAIKQRHQRTKETKIPIHCCETQLKALEARVDLLESWAIKHGGKLK